MIARQFLGAVGAAVDWSLIHLLAAISDRVEGRGANCYRRADALADMEAGRDHLEPGDITHVASIKDVLSVKSEPSEAAKEALRRRSGIPTWSCADCGKRMNTIVAAGSPTKRGIFCSAKCAANAPEVQVYRPSPEFLAAAMDMQRAPNKRAVAAEPSLHGFSGECPTDKSSCGCGRSAAVTTPAADNTTDHLTALLDYLTPIIVSSGFWGCEGCSWIGPKTGHSRHVAELITDMTAATGRVQQKLGGAS